MRADSIKCNIGITVTGYMWGAQNDPMPTADLINDPMGYRESMTNMNQAWVRQACCEGVDCSRLKYQCATTEKHYTINVYNGYLKSPQGFSYSKLSRTVLEGRCVQPETDLRAGDFASSCLDLASEVKQEETAKRAEIGVSGTAVYKLRGCTITNRTDVCTSCPAGTYSNSMATGLKSCLSCMHGRYGRGGSTDMFCDGTCAVGTYEGASALYGGRERIVGEEDEKCAESTWVLSVIIASCLIGVTLMIILLLWFLLKTTRPHEPKKIIPGQEELKGDHSHTGMLMNHM
jgi:hypothetical protein